MTTIRAATVDDARGIAEVHVAGWRWAYEDLLPSEYLEQLSVDEREGHWRETLSSSAGGVIVAEGAGEIVGFVGFGAADEAEPGTGEVHAIYLLDRAAGTGVGRELFLRANEELRRSGFRRAVLWVLETNERARRFYERAGWHLDGTRSSHRFDCNEQPVVRYSSGLSMSDPSKTRGVGGTPAWHLRCDVARSRG
jgi:RimJ/RimL family protein N-acetyltransferase